MSYRKEDPELENMAAFPDRECAVCGRRGGGAPNGGLDNVVVTHGRELCGHHVLARKRSTQPQEKTP